jgi:hypothetical protein
MWPRVARAQHSIGVPLLYRLGITHRRSASHDQRTFTLPGIPTAVCSPPGPHGRWPMHFELRSPCEPQGRPAVAFWHQCCRVTATTVASTWKGVPFECTGSWRLQSNNIGPATRAHSQGTVAHTSRPHAVRRCCIHCRMQVSPSCCVHYMPHKPNEPQRIVGALTGPGCRPCPCCRVLPITQVCVVLHVAVFTGTSATRPVSPHTSNPRFTTLTHCSNIISH